MQKAVSIQFGNKFDMNVSSWNFLSNCFFLYIFFYKGKFIIEEKVLVQLTGALIKTDSKIHELGDTFPSSFFCAFLFYINNRE